MAVLDFYDANGELEKQIKLTIPYYIDNMSGVSKLLLSGLTADAEKKAANIIFAAASPDLKDVYLSLAGGSTFLHFSPGNYSSNTQINISSGYSMPGISHSATILKMNFSEGNLCI